MHFLAEGDGTFAVASGHRKYLLSIRLILLILSKNMSSTGFTGREPLKTGLGKTNVKKS